MSEEPYKCTICKRLLCKFELNLQPFANQLNVFAYLFLPFLAEIGKGFFHQTRTQVTELKTCS